jgi:hypothetical protein
MLNRRRGPADPAANHSSRRGSGPESPLGGAGLLQVGAKPPAGWAKEGSPAGRLPPREHRSAGFRHPGSRPRQRSIHAPVIRSTGPESRWASSAPPRAMWASRRAAGRFPGRDPEFRAARTTGFTGDPVSRRPRAGFGSSWLRSVGASPRAASWSRPGGTGGSQVSRQSKTSSSIGATGRTSCEAVQAGACPGVQPCSTAKTGISAAGSYGPNCDGIPGSIRAATPSRASLGGLRPQPADVVEERCRSGNIRRYGSRSQVQGPRPSSGTSRRFPGRGVVDEPDVW